VRGSKIGILGKTKPTAAAAKQPNEPPVYIACGSYILNPVLEAETLELLQTLRRAHTDATEEYNRKLEAIDKLQADYVSYNTGGIPSHPRRSTLRNPFDGYTGVGSADESEQRGFEKQRKDQISKEAEGDATVLPLM